MEQRLAAPHRLRGTISPPPDKSISHRAAIFGAIADGCSHIGNFLYAEDCLSTVRCLRALGVTVEEGEGSLLIHGVGRHGLRESFDVLDAGNSGTTMRLLSGLLAGQPFFSILTGDESLRQRPMGRIATPLRMMGAQIWGRSGGTLAPLAITGGNLQGIHYSMPVASAQVKSSLILAALFAQGETVIHEPSPSRDHTERVLRSMGADVREEAGAVRVKPLSHEMLPLSMCIPGDISAAAYWMVAAAIHPDAEVYLSGVGINPTRTGVIDVLRAMGADISIIEERQQGGEPVADIVVRSSSLRGTVIEGPLIPRLIDEVPVLAVAAALAEGETAIRDAAELRVKESDRITTTAQELRRLGARVQETEDGLIIQGGQGLRGALAHSHGDHRLAMTLGVAAMVAQGETTIADAEAVRISYPGFWQDWGKLAGV